MVLANAKGRSVMLAPVLKLCKKCGCEKPLDAFHRKTQSADGRNYHCRECSSVLNAEWREKNPDKVAANIRVWKLANPGKAADIQRRHYQTIHGRANALRNSAKFRRPEGFTVTLEHIKALIETGTCPVTGIAFDMTPNRNGKFKRSWSPYAPSLDRIDSRQPYTNENTRVVIWQYNLMKGELSDNDVLSLCWKVVERATSC